MNNSFFQSGEASNEYKQIRDNPCDEKFRQRVDILWNRFRPYNPDQECKILDEAKKDLNAVLWQMRMTVFLSEKFNLQKPGPVGPDCTIQTEHGKYLVEAVSVNSGNNSMHCFKPMSEDGGHFDEYGYMLRITNAICKKKQQYNRWLKNKQISQNEPFIVAINCGNLMPDSILANTNFPDQPTIIKTLFAVNGFAWTQGQGHSEIKIQHKNSVRKTQENGVFSLVPTDTFLSASSSEISAVFWSGLNYLNMPDSGSDLIVAHNPYAKNPIPIDAFQFGKVFWLADDKLNSKPYY